MKKPILRLAQGALVVSLPLPMAQCAPLKLSRVADRPAIAEPYQPRIEAAAAISADSPVGGGFHPQTVGFSPSQNHQQTGTTLVAAKKTSRGIGSFYRVRTNGTRTASGIPLKDSVSTAAHRSLPFGTLVRVTNLKNGKSEVVKITDRGPFIKGRIIDVSLNAATKLGMVKSGIVPVEIEVFGRHDAS